MVALLIAEFGVRQLPGRVAALGYLRATKQRAQRLVDVQQQPVGG